jgi:hypothetical protein
LPQVREWAFLVQWQDLATILLTQLKVWRDLELQDQVRHVLEQDLRVDPIVQVQDLAAAELVQVLVGPSQVLVAVHPEVGSQPEVQPEVAVAA